MIVENALKTYSTTLEKIFPTLLQKRSKVSYIGLAIFLLVVQQTYSFLNAPRQLRRFPKISFFAVVKSFLTNESVFNRTKRLVTPLMNAGHKFYVSRVPLTWSIYIIDPVATRTLLLKTENLPKSHRFFDTLGADSPIVQFMGSDNVAISNGETWKKQRKIMNPAFHRSMPVKTFGSVVPHLFAAIEKEPDAFPITVRMKNFTLDVLGLAAFGFDFQSLKGDPEGWTKTYDVVVSSLFNPWLNIFAKLDFLLKYISPERRRVMRATTKFNGMLDDLTNKKRQEILQKANSDIPENEKDLLTLMIEADMRDNNGDTSNEELRHNIALFFLAGHETTAHTLTFCFYNLAKNKHVQRKAREEVLRILGDEPVDVIPTLEEMKQMDYINMVIKENLRRCGPVDKLFTRRTVEDIDLAGTIIPKGSDISVDIAALHMDPKTWKNPEQFIPERFEEGGEFDKRSGGLTWAPFSNGSRQCLGMNFSLTEQRLVLSMLLKKYEIDVPKDSIHYDEIIFDKPMNFAPNSLKLKFTKRY